MKKIVIVLPVILLIAILSHIQVNADALNHTEGRSYVMLYYVMPDGTFRQDNTYGIYVETDGNFYTEQYADGRLMLKYRGNLWYQDVSDGKWNTVRQFTALNGGEVGNLTNPQGQFKTCYYVKETNYEFPTLPITSNAVLVTYPGINQTFTDKSPDIKYKIYGYTDVTIKFYNSNGTMYHEHSGLCAGDSEQTYLAEAYNSYPGQKATEVGKSGFNGVNTVKFYDTATGNLLAQRSWTNNIEFSVTPPTSQQSDFYYVKYAYPSKDGQKFAGGNNLINTTVIGRVPIDLNKYKLEQIKFEFKGYLRYGEADTPTITKHDGYIEFGISANGEPVAGENKKFQFVLTMPNGTVYTAERIYTFYTDFVDTNNDGKDDRTGDQQVEPYTPEAPSKPMDIWDWIGKLPTILSNAFNAAASCVVLIGNLGTIMTTTFGFLPIGISSVLILGCMCVVVLKLFAR